VWPIFDAVVVDVVLQCQWSFRMLLVAHLFVLVLAVSRLVLLLEMLWLAVVRLESGWVLLLQALSFFVAKASPPSVMIQSSQWSLVALALCRCHPSSCTVLTLIVVSFTLINGEKGSMEYVTESVSKGVANDILSLLPVLFLPVIARLVRIDVSCFSCVALLGVSGSIGAVVVGCWMATSMSVIPAAMRLFVLAIGMGTLVGNQSTVSDTHSARNSQSQNV
jgi:hypothetical protein